MADFRYLMAGSRRFSCKPSSLSIRKTAAGRSLCAGHRCW
ncbi:hypothetical protein HMPREF1380_02435 [Enterococcus faecium R499]|uniref:Uncharacterized protein n=1 Tax=Enterococcus faecium R496 TaxID=1134836 RepID=A0AAV3GTS9_ENTFC|nr:hypothetical protein HMPREF1382_01529 [Enterococcus faecium S447]EJX46931.1 hypothetical protein HMPREF1380_02435 [Enterococcus faecium R499]EJX51317.1 hypothetical protein HMPREF1378_02104 [Enterococcus faecium R496]EJX60087.1 hypothetical protein HMPREF1376_02433 [Enterococcus faecium R446]EJX65412.1 hypothetical protein HMPREF1375_01425 [Enterococcus faecium P1986]EJX70016.1 hypothetical protein HMPREF1373_02021 [Enterococcus faecium P1140]EJX96032.1 hypothetical protein HMPREF1365_0110